MTFDDSNFVFAVATCGSETGNALKLLGETLPLQSAYSVQMPNNYVKGYPVDKPEKIEAYVKAAKLRLPEIAKEIMDKNPTISVVKGKFPGVRTGLIGAAFCNFALRTDGFKVDDTCTSCGKCVEVCPTETITLKNGRPVWGKDCTQCSA